MTNGIPVTVLRATEELRKYRHGLTVMSGGLTLEFARRLGARHRQGLKAVQHPQKSGTA